jgi:hypothetical protein
MKLKYYIKLKYYPNIKGGECVPDFVEFADGEEPVEPENFQHWIDLSSQRDKSWHERHLEPHRKQRLAEIKERS